MSLNDCCGKFISKLFSNFVEENGRNEKGEDLITLTQSLTITLINASLFFLYVVVFLPKYRSFVNSLEPNEGAEFDCECSICSEDQHIEMMKEINLNLNKT